MCNCLLSVILRCFGVVRGVYILRLGFVYWQSLNISCEVCLCKLMLGYEAFLSMLFGGICSVDKVDYFS